ncbi:MAG: alpha-amylase [Ignavibacteriae bacterium]|nr:alpha-amylase [Ignavibacteriota bacterium]NOG98065.1 alpha-amylase [Ignavibacteriota bacterium]
MRTKSRLFFSAIILSFLFANSCSTANNKAEKITRPEWSKNASIYEVNIRQYTPEGTFKAFEKHLPRLKEMGIDILWLMPIHPIGEKNRKGTLGSYYSVKDYKGVNPSFGTHEDFRNLVDKIHDMGMYVIIDWVANHTAWDHPWTESNPEFYTKDESDKFISPVDDWFDVIDLNYDNKELWTEMIDALKFWVDDYNIDGYRCDVAAMVPTEFWEEARTELDKVKPVFMLAEAHEPDLHKAFDMTYGWQLKDLMNDIAAGKKNALDIVKFVEAEKEEYPSDAYRMLFSTNHDENTWNGTVFERLGDAAEVFAVLFSTLEGMPLVYSGQEAGLDKRLDFFEKDLIEWKDHKFYEIFTKLFKLKKENEALWNGNFGGEVMPIESGISESVFSFYRTKNNHTIIAVLNFSNQKQNVELKNSYINGTYISLFENDEQIFNGDDKLTLEPFSYKVYFKK